MTPLQEKAVARLKKSLGRVQDQQRQVKGTRKSWELGERARDQYLELEELRQNIQIKIGDLEGWP